MNNKKQIVDALKASGLVEDTGASVKPHRHGGDGESKPTFAGAIMNECESEFEAWAKAKGVWEDRVEDHFARQDLLVGAWQAAWNRRAVLEGYQLVPKEPTQEMLKAPHTVVQEHAAKLIYQRMLAAAPKPENV